VCFGIPENVRNIHIAADNSTQQQTEHNKEEYKKNA
jgi:hypothetical protein